MVVNRWSFDKEELEDFCDRVKIAIVRKLVSDGLLDFSEADVWAGHNTALLKKKTVFRTLSNVYFKREEANGHFLNVVEINKKDSDYFKGIEDEKNGKVLKLVDKKDDEND